MYLDGLTLVRIIDLSKITSRRLSGLVTDKTSRRLPVWICWDCLLPWRSSSFAITREFSLIPTEGVLEIPFHTILIFLLLHGSPLVQAFCNRVITPEYSSTNGFELPGVKEKFREDRISFPGLQVVAAYTRVWLRIMFLTYPKVLQVAFPRVKMYSQHSWSIFMLVLGIFSEPAASSDLLDKLRE